MAQPGHATIFLHYRHFSFFNPISIKIKTGNCKYVESNEIYYCIIGLSGHKCS